MEKIKNWLIVHLAEEVKLITAIIMYATAFLMIYDKLVDTNALPNYFEFSKYDWWVWLFVLITFATSNLIGLWFVDYFKARIACDLILQLSGFILVIIGMAFIAHYPPLNWLMFFYTIWGMFAIIAGRHMGKRSRKRLAECKKIECECKKG